MYASGRFFILVIFLLLTLSCSTIGQRKGIHRKIEECGYSNITVMDLIDKMAKNEDFILLDVRTPAEYAEGHIEGAILIPHTEIETQHPKLGCKCEKIVVYCKSGKRSEIACRSFVELGFHKVENLNGGIEAWIEMGGPISKNGIED